MIQSPKSTPSTHKSCFTLFFASTFAALFVISTVAVLLLYFPIKNLFNPDFYKQSLADHQFYQKLPAYIAQKIATGIKLDQCEQNPISLNCLDEGISETENTHNERQALYFPNLDQQDWEDILTGLIDPAWLQTQVEIIIDQVFHILFISPDPRGISIGISLEEIKSHLAGEAGTQAMLEILYAQPACSLDQVLGLFKLGSGQTITIDSILCKPPDSVITELTPILQSFFINLVNLVPEEINIKPADILADTLSYDKIEPTGTTAIASQIQTLRTTRLIISLSPLVPFLLICLLTIIAVRSLKDFLFWWGVSLLPAGFFTIVISFSALPLRDWGLRTIFQMEGNGWLGLSTFLIELGFEDIIREITKDLIMSILIPAGVIFLIGLLLGLGYLILNKQNTRRAELENIKTLRANADYYSD